MAVVAVFQGSTLTRDSYGAVVRKLTGGKKSRMEAVSDWGSGGLLAHIAGDAKGGFRVIDVWESEEAMGRFAARLMPILHELQMTDVVPEVYPTHALVTA